MGWIRFTPVVTKGGLALGAVALLSLSACNDLGEDARTYSVPGASVFAGDLDGDGDVDLLSGGGDAYAYLLNDGTGTFTTGVVAEHVDLSRSVLMDVDGDAAQDVVVLIPSPGDPPAVPPTVYLVTRLSNGDGTFGEPAVVGSTSPVTGEHSAMVITAGDMNADGHGDVVVYESSEGQLGSAVVFLWTGPNSFGPAMVTSSSSYVLTDGQLNHAASATSDLTGDGKLDLVVAGWGPWPGDPWSRGQIAVMTGDGAGGFTATASYPTIEGDSNRAIGPGVGDFDEDGRLDVVTADSRLAAGPETLTFWFGTSDGTLSGPVSRSGRGEQDTDLAVGDVDGDGHRDIVTIATTYVDETGAGWFMRGDGTGQIADSTELGAAVPRDEEHGGVILRDLDGDGKLDLAVSNGLDTITVFRNRLGT